MVSLDQKKKHSNAAECLLRPLSLHSVQLDLSTKASVSGLSRDLKSQEERLEQSVSQLVYDRFERKRGCGQNALPEAAATVADSAWRSRQEVQVVNYSLVCLLQKNIVERGRGVGKHIADH